MDLDVDLEVGLLKKPVMMLKVIVAVDGAGSSFGWLQNQLALLPYGLLGMISLA